MYWSLGRLRGWRLEAADGEIGEVSDFLFDDSGWVVRWLVVDTGRWLPGRLVLIAPQALREPEEAHRRFPVALTRAQVANSPDVDTRKPVSRQQEMDLHGYWGWWPYWSADAAAAPPPAPAEPAPDAPPPGEPHLRSVAEVIGYDADATDGRIGRFADLLAGGAPGWPIRWLVLETGRWLPGRRILAAPGWVTDIDWISRRVRLDVSRAQVAASPAEPADTELDEAWENRLFAHYGKEPHQAGDASRPGRGRG